MSSAGEVHGVPLEKLDELAEQLGLERPSIMGVRPEGRGSGRSTRTLLAAFYWWAVKNESVVLVVAGDVESTRKQLEDWSRSINLPRTLFAAGRLRIFKYSPRLRKELLSHLAGYRSKVLWDHYAEELMLVDAQNELASIIDGVQSIVSPSRIRVVVDELARTLWAQAHKGNRHVVVEGSLFGERTRRWVCSCGSSYTERERS